MFRITVTKNERRRNKLVLHTHGRILSSMFLFRQALRGSHLVSAPYHNLSHKYCRV